MRLPRKCKLPKKWMTLVFGLTTLEVKLSVQVNSTRRESPMARHKFFVVGVVCLLALICGSIGMYEQSTTAAEPEAKTLVTISYQTADLPIWKEKGDGFDHSILIALLKANIGTEGWGGSHSIASYPESVSLIVSTTKDNHAVIAETLSHLRLESSKRTPDFKRSPK